ncbi:MAG: recombinase family protein, partial [Octadecabacter sp.]|nr:recombinase family protein [Octadecabacter sp.]
SFAQFEREVTAERIRDKIAASKRKGLWMGGLVPIGYDADGRTLRINEAEARTVRTLYDLYEDHGVIRLAKEHADRLRLRTKLRAAADGAESGGVPFTRGHIHQILTNPLYAGRIRHRGVVHDGQHPALIDPDRWNRVQAMLQDGAAKVRRAKTGTTRSLLCGKLFDETGDRLTPSHTKTRTGKRLRYYVSHRLIAKSGEDRDGWRLPAPELEEQIAGLVRIGFSKPSFVSLLMPDASASQTGAAKATLADWLERDKIKHILQLIDTITISPGRLECSLNASALGRVLHVEAVQLNEDALLFSSLFQLRKRGVETKLIFADLPTGQDPKLIANIAKAHAWFELIKSGQTLDQVAASEQTSKRRIQQMIELAFLAPDIIRDVLDGKQPIGFTSQWAKNHSIPGNWDDQRKLFTTL